MGYLLTLMVTLNLNSFVKVEYPLFLGYPVIAGYCLINDMSEYKCTFSQESFSVVAFWQELIYDIDKSRLLLAPLAAGHFVIRQFFLNMTFFLGTKFFRQLQKFTGILLFFSSMKNSGNPLMKILRPGLCQCASPLIHI